MKFTHNGCQVLLLGRKTSLLSNSAKKNLGSLLVDSKPGMSQQGALAAKKTKNNQGYTKHSQEFKGNACTPLPGTHFTTSALWSWVPVLKNTSIDWSKFSGRPVSWPEVGVLVL